MAHILIPDPKDKHYILILYDYTTKTIIAQSQRALQFTIILLPSLIFIPSEISWRQQDKWDVHWLFTSNFTNSVYHPGWYSPTWWRTLLPEEQLDCTPEEMDEAVNGYFGVSYVSFPKNADPKKRVSKMVRLAEL